MTATTRTQTPTAHDDTRPNDDAPATNPPATLSLKQIVASGLAAVSTTVLLSYFGIAGTIVGAGVASVLTVVANYLYTRSIERTHEQLVCRVRPAADAGSGTKGRVTDASAEARPSHSSAEAPPRNALLRLVDRHGRTRVLAVAAAALFVVVMGVVLVFELFLGRPLAAAVTGQEGSGTSIGGAVSSQTDTTDDRSGTTEDRSGTTDSPADVPDLPSDEVTDTGDTPSDGTTDAPTSDPTTDGPSGDDDAVDGDIDGDGTTDGDIESSTPGEETGGGDTGSGKEPGSAPDSDGSVSDDGPAPTDS